MFHLETRISSLKNSSVEKFHRNYNVQCFTVKTSLNIVLATIAVLLPTRNISSFTTDTIANARKCMQ